MKTIFLKGLCGLSLVMIPEAVLASSMNNLKSVSPHQYTHLIETYQSQTFEPLSQTALFSEQSALNNSYKTAGVVFIVKDKEQDFSFKGEFDNPAAKCYEEGYKITATEEEITVNDKKKKTTACSGNLVDACSYDSSMFKTCCPLKYKYSQSQCQFPYSISADSCGGKYECVCDKSLFPVTATSCEAPMIPASGNLSSCVENGVTYVSECVCPSNYTETCSGTHIKGKGVGCTKNGETKYTSCECESGYNYECSGNNTLPESPSDYCLKDGIRYYKGCKPVYVGCPTGSVDLDNYWCEGALKCVIK